MYTDRGEDFLSACLVVNSSFRLLKTFEAFCGVILLHGLPLFLFFLVLFLVVSLTANIVKIYVFFFSKSVHEGRIPPH